MQQNHGKLGYQDATLIMQEITEAWSHRSKGTILQGMNTQITDIEPNVNTITIPTSKSMNLRRLTSHTLSLQQTHPTQVCNFIQCIFMSNYLTKIKPKL